MNAAVLKNELVNIINRSNLPPDIIQLVLENLICEVQRSMLMQANEGLRNELEKIKSNNETMETAE